VRRIEVRVFLPGVVNGAVPVTLVTSGLVQSCDGCLAGSLAEESGVLPDVDGLGAEGDRLRAAASPSWPETGTLPARPWAGERGNDAAGHAVVLGETASTLLLLAVRNCSISVWALAGSQLSV
jgi:hypothetical protein